MSASATYDVDDLLKRYAELDGESSGLVKHWSGVLDVATMMKDLVDQTLLVSSALHFSYNRRHCRCQF